MSVSAAMPILRRDRRSLSSADSSRVTPMRGTTGAGRKVHVDLVVRGAGVALVALACLAVLALVRSPTLGGRDGPSGIDAVLAAASFLSASFGMAAICLGGHVFERVMVSDRWRRRDVPRDA
jgi:hypothetical protein